MTICVARIDQVPEDLRWVLEEHVDEFKEAECVEQLLRNPALMSVAIELNEICEREGVVGFHFTRAHRGAIEAQGLVIERGKDRRAKFLRDHGDLFSEEQRRRIQALWTGYFKGMQNSSREGRVYFSLTLKPLEDGGAEYLLRYYGGERIYKPLVDDPELAKVLESIGESLIVECRLCTKRCRAYHAYPWGTVWLSSWHRHWNANALQHDQDVAAYCPIPPSDVISIREYSPESGSTW